MTSRITRASAKRTLATTGDATKRLRTRTDAANVSSPIKSDKSDGSNVTVKQEESDFTVIKSEANDIKVVKQEVDAGVVVKRELDDGFVIKQETKDHTTVKKEPNDDPTITTTVKQETETILPSFDMMKPNDISPPKLMDQYNKIVGVRNQIIAPVDTMGCERIPFTVDPSSSPRMFRFQLLVSLMLSSQTKDEVTHAAVAKMHAHFKGGLSLEAILQASEAEIDQLIGKVGFHRRKANYLKRTAEILRSEHQGDIPKSIEEIVKLPGVGPKMGFLLLQAGWDISTGIGVDVHLHRIANLLGWVSSKTPEATRNQLEQNVPSEYWKQINPLVVGFGQTVCLPQAPLCDICPLASQCRGANKKLINQPRTEARKLKLLASRGDISRLIDW